MNSFQKFHSFLNNRIVQKRLIFSSLAQNIHNSAQDDKMCRHKKEPHIKTTNCFYAALIYLCKLCRQNNLSNKDGVLLAEMKHAVITLYNVQHAFCAYAAVFFGGNRQVVFDFHFAAY